MSEYIIDLGASWVTDYAKEFGVLNIGGWPVKGEVVRCRDCKYYRDHEWIIASDVGDVCHFFGDGVKVEPGGFCSWGERK